MGDTVVLALFAALVGYEAYAVGTQCWGDVRVPTISETVWRYTRRYPWLKWVGTALGIVLILHFWWGLR